MPEWIGDGLDPGEFWGLSGPISTVVASSFPNENPCDGRFEFARAASGGPCISHRLGLVCRHEYCGVSVAKRAGGIRSDTGWTVEYDGTVPCVESAKGRVDVFSITGRYDSHPRKVRRASTGTFDR
jgi:hypothetical protein